VQAGRDPDALEGLLPFEPFSNEPQHRHGRFGPFDLESSLVGQLDVSHIVIHKKPPVAVMSG
jgi:hypothetical protein